MNEQKLAERFCRDVDRIWEGEGAELNPAGPLPDEYRKAFDLARTLAGDDFSSECKVREGLRRRLLDMFEARGIRPAGKSKFEYGELDDEELMNVAGGVENGKKESCSLCDCRRSSHTITGDTCPDCGHPRGCHPV